MQAGKKAGLIKLGESQKNPLDNPQVSKIFLAILFGHRRFRVIADKLGLSERNLYYHLATLEKIGLIKETPAEEDGRIKDYSPRRDSIYYLALYMQFLFGFQYDWFPSDFSKSKALFEKIVSGIRPADLNNMPKVMRLAAGRVNEYKAVLEAELKAFNKKHGDNMAEIGLTIEEKTPHAISAMIKVALKKLEELPEEQQELLLRWTRRVSSVLVSILLAIYFNKEKILKETKGAKERKELEEYFKAIEARKMYHKNILLVMLGSLYDKDSVQFITDVISNVALIKELPQADNYLIETLQQLDLNLPVPLTTNL